MILNTLGRSVALVSVIIERYALSVVFFVIGYRHGYGLAFPSQDEAALIHEHPVAEIFRQVIWIQFDFFSGILLLLGRPVAVLPKNLKDILVPLASTFFYLSYEGTRFLPARLSQNLCPAAWQSACLTLGLLMNLAGLGIAIWGVLSLGRSFGLLIEVRKVVVEGAYRRMRHPIYFGYFFFLTGFAISYFSLIFFTLVPAQIALLIYRARLEEARLAENSPQYREYQKRTGFLFPKFKIELD